MGLRPGPVAIWLAVACGLGGSTPGTEAAETLRWKFKAGDTLRFAIEQKSNMSVKAMGTERKSTLAMEVRPLQGQVPPPPGATDEEVWRVLGLKTLAVPSEYVSSVSAKLRGGLYVQAVLPGSPAAEAAIQKGDILLGMKVGNRHWETIRPDNILYVLRQPETVQTQSAVFYVVRKNEVQPRRITLGGALNPSSLSR